MMRAEILEPPCTRSSLTRLPGAPASLLATFSRLCLDCAAAVKVRSPEFDPSARCCFAFAWLRQRLHLDLPRVPATEPILGLQHLAIQGEQHEHYRCRKNTLERANRPED